MRTVTDQPAPGHRRRLFGARVGSCERWVLGTTLLVVAMSGCREAGPNPADRYRNWVSLDDRKLEISDDNITLDNAETDVPPDKRLVVLTLASKLDVVAERPQLVSQAKLNVISGNHHNCGGNVVRSGDTLTVGLSGTSDRCAMFSDKWYLPSSSALSNAKAATQIPAELHGNFRLAGATLHISSTSIRRESPSESDPAKRTVVLSIRKASTTSGVTSLEVATLNTITQAGKTCTGTLQGRPGQVTLNLSGNSDRCELLNGEWR